MSTTAEKGQHGSRAPETVERDQAVVDRLHQEGPQTVSQIAEALSLGPVEVDESLQRLQLENEARKIGAKVWTAAEEKRLRGRPRPKETIVRDRAVAGQLERGGPQTRNQIAQALHMKQSLVYLCLQRLRRQGTVRKCAGEGAHTIWSVDGKCE